MIIFKCPISNVLALVCLFKPPKQLRLSYGTSGLSTMYVQMVSGHWTSSIQFFLEQKGQLFIN